VSKCHISEQLKVTVHELEHTVISQQAANKKNCQYFGIQDIELFDDF
jgi:hypothetical protein